MADPVEYLRRIPKVELHCHLEGSVRAETAVELARRHSVTLPTYEPSELYDFDGIVEFLVAYVAVSRSIIDREDFARVTYESLEDQVRLGNLRYREMFFNPTNHYADGVSYDTCVDGVIDGIRAAETDLGVRCNLIVAINKSEPPADAVALVEQVIASPRDEIIGIGQDHLTPDNLETPQLFAEAYELAKRNGLNITAHAGEIDASTSADVAAALDLGCLRVDHGYHILDDEAVVARARDAGVVFTGCLHSSALLYGWDDFTAHPIRTMIAEGLRMTFNTDDPTMLNTDLGKEYAEGCPKMGLTIEQAEEIALTGVDASWLPDDEKAEMREEFLREMAELRSALL